MADVERLLAAYDAQLRLAGQATLPPGVVARWDGPVLRVAGHHRGFVSGPADLGVAGADLDALIARQRDFFAARGEAVEWKVWGHDRPADLPARLRAAGFVAEDEETVLVAPTRAVAARPATPPRGVVLREVGTDADLDRLARLQARVWGADFGWLAAELRQRRDGAGERLHVVAAEAGPRMVAVAWLVITPGVDFGGLWGGATLPGWRGRGVYRALVAYRAQVAAAARVPYLQVDASAQSRPILRRLGFAALTTTTPFVWTPPDATRP
ncbi:GNAT family N-acetyltransferase [Pilimelia terevasa]|uniref:GNAT family N-acetyltransferase n=1 Tax=Pilimelia terevasa TaxID=53372 RepID=UPI0016698021|nr:GNAT family N-acetyltransferase [Pilimelia terevasa]